MALSVVRSGGYIVTPKGQADRRELATCQCEIHLVGLLFECEHCGTVYGHARDQVAGYPQQKRRSD